MFNIVKDAQNDPPRAGWTLLRDIGSERNQILNCLRRPEDVHLADRLGAGCSCLRSQELTQPLTSLCETPSPRSSEVMARLTPPTCHSFTSRYSLSASAARKDRVRPLLLASFSSRFLTSDSTRTVKVVEGIVPSLVFACIRLYTL